MIHMTDQEIEAAFDQVREKFEKTENKFGLEMLDNIEGRWEAIGELSDRQLAWLDRQVNQSWKRKKAKVPSNTITMSEQSERLVKVSAVLLDKLTTDVQRISQILDQLKRQFSA